MKNVLIAGLALLAVIAGLVVYLQRPQVGVRQIVWDQEACAHCHMHIGDPRFAAQLQTDGGDVLNFDDPGCLFAYLDSNSPTVKEIYFHHYLRDEWLALDTVGFVRTEQDTPMGYGIGAVKRSEMPDAMSLEEAHLAMQQQEHSRAMLPVQTMHKHAGAHK